jgi:hypothetical protein
MSAWYDLPPSGYARGLRYHAARSDESAARKEAEGKSWSVGEAERYRRQARRLRAMALLCDASAAATAGGVDFLGMTDPSQPRDAEDAAIARAESLVKEAT